MAFSSNLQQLRKAANLSQEALAEQLHISRQAVSKWESGQSVPDTDTCMKVCDILGVTPNQLLLGEDGAAPSPAIAPADSRHRSDHGIRSLFPAVVLLCGTALMICNLYNPHYFEPNIHILSLLMIFGSIIAFSCAALTRTIRKKKKR